MEEIETSVSRGMFGWRRIVLGRVGYGSCPGRGGTGRDGTIWDRTGRDGMGGQDITEQERGDVNGTGQDGMGSGRDGIGMGQDRMVRHGTGRA